MPEYRTQAYAYDGFGNLTGKTPTQGYAPAMTGSADSNATGGALSGQWDVEKRPMTQGVTQATPFYVYDPWGRRVWRQWYNSQYGTTNCEAYFYGATGQKLESYSCQYTSGSLGATLEGINTYFAGKMLSEKGVFIATDRLGSVRGDSNGVTMSYFPWGEERGQGTTDGRTKFAGYYRDMPGQDYANARYYSASTGSFWSPDPGGVTTAISARPLSWNRYGYVEGDPINFVDPQGLFLSNPCAEDPTQVGCNPDDPPVKDPNPGGGGGTGGGGGGGPAPSSNPCAFGNLTATQQGMVNSATWGGFSAAQQQEFMDITDDAAFLGVPLGGLTITNITIAAPGGASQTEVNFGGDTAALTQWLDGTSSGFTCQSATVCPNWSAFVGSPHPGYTGNYRQNGPMWSMQINTNATGAQIDIDPFNPAGGPTGLLGHAGQVGLHRITNGDTNPFSVRNALNKRGINTGAPCTGGN
jgi:RHS repeat-associated protein